MTKQHSGSYDVRSKNAGPFWLTIDIFCDDPPTFQTLCREPKLAPGAIGALFKTDSASVRIFKIAVLSVIKISLPRPVIQGALEDRDLHGAQWACLLQEELEKV